MGLILASTTINRAATALLDDAQASWLPAELLGYYNAGVRLVVLYKPDAGVQVSPLAMVAGVRQTTDGTFIGVKSNAAGLAVRQVDMDDLDHLRPSWRTAAPGPARHWMADKRQPNVFWLYPPSVDGDMVEVVRVVTPQPILASEPNPLDDAYEQIIYWLILAHAYAKNAKRGDVAKMSSYLNLATQGLGLKRQIQLEQSPMPTAQEQRNN